MIKCPYCFNIVEPVVRDDGGNKPWACPDKDCLQVIPREYVQGNLPKTTIGMVGFSGFGKSVYIHMLFYMLDYMRQVWPDYYYNSLDDHTDRIIYESLPALRTTGRLPDSTPTHFSEPALLGHHSLPYYGNCFTSLYDTAGENFEAAAQITRNARKVAHCETVLFLVSLYDLGEDWQAMLDALLGKYVRACHDLIGTDLNTSQNLVVVVSKADLLNQGGVHTLTPRLAHYLSSGAYYDYQTIGSSTRERMEGVSLDIEKWFLERGCHGFVRKAKDTFKTVAYSLVSATGIDPASDNTFPEPPVPENPKRVLDPFVWALERMREQPQKAAIVITSYSDSKRNNVQSNSRFSKIKGLFSKDKLGKNPKLLIFIVITLVAILGYGIPKAFSYYQLSSALKLYYAGNYTEAFKKFEPLANKGNPVAEEKLATLYGNGLGVQIDPVKELEWSRKAAEQKNPIGLTNMGIMTLLGRESLIQNAENAQEYCGKAVTRIKSEAEKGLFDYQQQLASMYFFGCGVPKDLEQAASWTQKAADHNFMPSITDLGYLYENGLGVELNQAKAVELYKNAAEKGYSQAQARLGDCYKNGTGVIANYRTMFDLYEKSAQQGNPAGYFGLGTTYHDGLGVPKDYQKAIGWFRKGTAKGDMLCFHSIGIMYDRGLGVNKSDADAVTWYRKAAESGHFQSQNLLGVKYAAGLGTTKDYKEAVAWFKKAAEGNNSDGQNNLGWMHENGLGVEKDIQKANEWYEKAAAQGQSDATKALARLGRGKGTWPSGEAPIK